MEKNDKLIVNFVPKSKDFKEMLELIKRKIEMRFKNSEVVIITQEKCSSMVEDLNKTEIFIFEEFSGPGFEYIHTNFVNTWILGLKSLLDFVLEENGYSMERKSSSHVFNFALKNIKVFIDPAVDQEEMEKIVRLTKFMGGQMNLSLEGADCLITNDIWKLRDAVKVGAKAMQTEWTFKLWKTCNSGHTIHSSKIQEIFDGSIMPIFDKLTVAITGFKPDEIKRIQKQVEENGGKFSKTFNKSVNILIINKGSETNEKHRVASGMEKLCLKPEWLSESLKKGYACNIEKFIIPFKQTSTPEKNSPNGAFIPEVSAIQNSSMKSVFDETARSSRESIAPLTRKSSRNTFAMPQPKTRKKSTAAFMTGKIVHVYKNVDHIKEILMKCGATVVDENFKNPVDYVICQDIFHTKFSIKLKNVSNIVNKAWLDDSISKGECIEIENYHRIVENCQSKKLLESENFVTSNYKSGQRTFIGALVRRLGGEFNEVLKKIDGPILIAPISEGPKYESAIEWNFTVLSMEWLVKCYKEQCRVDETPFLVGKSKASEKNKIERQSRKSKFEIPSSQEIYSPDEISFRSDPGLQKENIDHNGRATISMDSPLTTREEKIRGMMKSFKTPDRKKIASRLLKEVSNVDVKDNLTKYDPISELPASVQEILNRPANVDLEGFKFRLRPDESPESIRHHKEVLEMADMHYVEPTRPYEFPVLPDPEPAGLQRWLFYKRVLGDSFNEPDPRLKFTKPKSPTVAVVDDPPICKIDNISVEASNFLPPDSETHIDDENNSSITVPETDD